MKRRKIDIELLLQMLDEGKSQADCARYFDVSNSAITQCLKKHRQRQERLKNIQNSSSTPMIPEVVNDPQKLINQWEPIIWNNEPCITFQMIEQVHLVAPGTPYRNFDRNRRHYEGGYYEVSYDQALSVNRQIVSSQLIEPNPSTGLILLNEWGYLCAVKSLQDDLAWGIYRIVLDGYFRGRNIPHIAPHADYVTKELFHSEMDGLKSQVKGNTELLYLISDNTCAQQIKRKDFSLAFQRTYNLVLLHGYGGRCRFNGIKLIDENGDRISDKHGPLGEYHHIDGYADNTSLDNGMIVHRKENEKLKSCKYRKEKEHLTNDFIVRMHQLFENGIIKDPRKHKKYNKKNNEKPSNPLMPDDNRDLGDPIKEQINLF